MTSATERKIRYAVVGAGNIAQTAILPAFANATENCELVAVISGDTHKQKALAQRYGLRHVGAYEELERVAQAAGADAVYIATPNSEHRSMTERAARLGLHVLCEKPMAQSVEDCQAMIQACQRCGVRLMIAYRLHFEEANMNAVEIAQRGVLGEPLAFSSVFGQNVRPDDVRRRADLAGGALYDMGIYPINAARYLFRAEPEEVFAQTVASSDSSGVDVSTAAQLRFPGGRLAQLLVSFSSSVISSYRLLGTRGELRVEPAYDYDKDLVHHLTVDGTTVERSFPRRDQFAPELVAFSRAILDDKPAEPSGEEGLADVRIVGALLESARTGRSVQLPPFEHARRPGIAQVISKSPLPEVEPVHAPPPRL